MVHNLAVQEAPFLQEAQVYQAIQVVLYLLLLQPIPNDYTCIPSITSFHTSFLNKMHKQKFKKS